MQLMGLYTHYRNEIYKKFDLSGDYTGSYTDLQDFTSFYWHLEGDDFTFADTRDDILDSDDIGNYYTAEVYGSWELLRHEGYALIGLRGSDGAWHHSYCVLLDGGKEIKDLEHAY